MEEYVDRKYRKRFSIDRWKGFTICYKETDLWIGTDLTSWDDRIPEYAESRVAALRKEMDLWITTHDEYARSLVPIDCPDDAPYIFRKMAGASRSAGIGPMSAVAGAVAEHIGRLIKDEFNLSEIIVENGGDIYADICKDMDVSVFAGKSPLSDRVGLRIKADGQPFGICTSSGTVGPSLSFGKADAVMIVCRDVLLADTFATAYANIVKEESDVDLCIDKINSNPDIVSAIVIKNEKIGICGCMDFILI